MGAFRDEKKIAELLERIGGIETPVSGDLEERMISGLEAIAENYVNTDNNFTDAEKSKLSGINAGTRVLLRSGGSTVDLVSVTNNELDLGSGVNVADYSAIEIRYLQYTTGSTNCYATLRIVNSGGAYGNVSAVKYVSSSNSINITVSVITLTGSKIKLVDAGGTSQFLVSTVVGYK